MSPKPAPRASSPTLSGPAVSPVAAPETQTRLAYLLLLITFLIWSNSFVATRYLVGEDVPDAERLGPFHFVIARFAPVGLVCLLYFALSAAARREGWRLLREQPGLVVLLGLINVWAYNLAFAEGQHLVPAGTGSLIIALSPIFTFLLATLIGQEQPTLARAGGLLLALIGIYLVVVYGAGRAVGAAYITDAGILVLAPLSWAFYTVFSKPLFGRYAPVPATFLILGLASVPAIPFFFLDTQLRIQLSAWGPQRWFADLFLALACTLVGYWLWSEALKRLPASKTAAFIFLNPPLAIFFEWLWLGHRPQPGLIAGGLVVLSGIYLCLRPPKGFGGLAARSALKEPDKKP